MLTGALDFMQTWAEQLSATLVQRKMTRGIEIMRANYGVSFPSEALHSFHLLLGQAFVITDMTWTWNKITDHKVTSPLVIGARQNIH